MNIKKIGNFYYFWWIAPCDHGPYHAIVRVNFGLHKVSHLNYKRRPHTIMIELNWSTIIYLFNFNSPRTITKKKIINARNHDTCPYDHSKEPNGTKYQHNYWNTCWIDHSDSFGILHNKLIILLGQFDIMNSIEPLDF